MSRLFEAMSKGLTCLAMLCAILAVLAVPSTATADPLLSCEQQCANCSKEGSPSPYNTCIANCGGGISGPDCRSNPEEIGAGLAKCPVKCLDCKATNKDGNLVITGTCRPANVQGCEPCLECGVITIILGDNETHAVYCKV